MTQLSLFSSCSSSFLSAFPLGLHFWSLRFLSLVLAPHPHPLYVLPPSPLSSASPLILPVHMIIECKYRSPHARLTCLQDQTAQCLQKDTVTIKTIRMHLNWTRPLLSHRHPDLKVGEYLSGCSPNSCLYIFLLYGQLSDVRCLTSAVHVSICV